MMMVSLGMSDFYVRQTAVRFVYLRLLLLWYAIEMRWSKSISNYNYRSFSPMQFAGVHNTFWNDMVVII